ncbi:hypothetical protein CFP56_029856 [Quercus suber]|uniref:DUF4220 domain-containing protein n=1 Tax=Quercus suber TaxID=58331 RepID=A0AAW0JQN4_QUESU|nr:hypothetical protein CFP56_52985 [Quercus suber]
MADRVATVAQSVILSHLGDTTESIGKDGSLIDDIRLTISWAPFLLLHMGVALIPLQCIPWKITSFGTIKHGERTWVLRSASNGRFRESMLTLPDTGPNYSKFMQEYTLKQFEGFHVLADEVIVAQVVNLYSVENAPIRDATELVTAYDLIYIFKRLFVDLIRGFDDRDNSQSLFKKISWNKAFKVIEMELGFMYNMLYNKATVIHSAQ